MVILEGVRAGDVKTTNVRTVDRERTVADFVHDEAMTTRVSSFPVVDDLGNLHGLVTLRRLREARGRHGPRPPWALSLSGRMSWPWPGPRNRSSRPSKGQARAMVASSSWTAGTWSGSSPHRT